MADFRGMNRGPLGGPPGPPPNVMRPIGPGPMMNSGPIKPPTFPTLCPDFMKGVCSVFQCPKNHPEASLLFCQAYQRDCCQLGQTCTYMHATVEEEQYYKDTGLIPLRFMNKPIRMERGKGPLPNGQPSLFPTDAASPTTPTEQPFSTVPEPTPQEAEKVPAAPIDQPSKRQKLSYEEIEIERNMLKEKVKILEKKVEQLDATNEVLLEKNAKLRSSRRSPERRRSPDKDHRGRRDRRDRDRSRDRNRSRSKERARSKDGQDGGWKDNNSRAGGRWNDNFNNSNYNNNRPM